MKIRFNPEEIFAVIGFWYFTNALPRYLSPIDTPLRYGILLISAILLCLRWKSTLYTASKDKCLWLLTCLAAISWLWSVSPESTIQDVKGLLIPMTVFGLYIAARFSLEKQLKLLIFGLGIGIFLSLVAFAMNPSAVLNSSTWGGVYGHKQNFGSHMTLCLIALFTVAVNTQRHRVFAWMGISLVASFVLLSGSKSSLVFSILILSILFLYRKYRWRGKITVLLLDLGILVLGGLATVVISQWVPLVSSLGKGPTLSGRTIIWSSVIPMILKQPWLGYGRFGFWNNDQLVTEAIRGHFGSGLNAYVPPHAHNGYLDLMLDVGIIGASLFLISFLTTYAKALNQAYTSKHLGDVWPLACLTFILMDNLTESHLMRLQSVFWVLYIAVTLSLRKERYARTKSRHFEQENLQSKIPAG